MKEMTKKSLAIALAGAMCFALVGCGGGAEETTAETTASESTEAALDLNALTLDEIVEKAKEKVMLNLLVCLTVGLTGDFPGRD